MILPILGGIAKVAGGLFAAKGAYDAQKQARQMLRPSPVQQSLAADRSTVIAAGGRRVRAPGEPRRRRRRSMTKGQMQDFIFLKSQGVSAKDAAGLVLSGMAGKG